MNGKTSYTSLQFSEILEAKAVDKLYQNSRIPGFTPDNLFKGKKVVVTGTFSLFDRRVILSQLFNCGALLEVNVTAQTDILIVGNGFTEQKISLALANTTTNLLFENDIFFFYVLDEKRKNYYRELVEFNAEKAKLRVNGLLKLINNTAQ